jgi:hypothetical protein
MLDSILSDRPYAPGKPLAWALEEAARCAGSYFDPDVVAALQRVALVRGPGFFAISAAPSPNTPVVAGESIDKLIPFLVARADLPTSVPV